MQIARITETHFEGTNGRGQRRVSVVFAIDFPLAYPGKFDVTMNVDVPDSAGWLKAAVEQACDQLASMGSLLEQDAKKLPADFD